MFSRARATSATAGSRYCTYINNLILLQYTGPDMAPFVAANSSSLEHRLLRDAVVHVTQYAHSRASSRGTRMSASWFTVASNAPVLEEKMCSCAIPRAPALTFVK